MSSGTLPLVVLAGATIPLLVLGYFWKVFPARRLVSIGFVPAVLSLGLIGTPGALPWILGLDTAVLLVAIGDLATLPRRKHLVAERESGRIVSLGKAHDVSLVVSNLHARRTIRLDVRDGVPQDLDPQPAEFSVEIEPQTRVVLPYRLHSRRRGAFRLEAVYFRVRGSLGLWNRHLERPVETVLHVYPDLKQVGEYALLAKTDRLNLMGVRRSRRVGQDNDFERLRDYTVGDNYRHIDWRTTARRRKLTVKEFQTNREQRLVFLIDCGRMMSARAAGLSLLDHSLNAMLMLAYVALSHGDSVGLVCFSDRIHSFVPPRGGRRHMNRLLHAAFDQFPNRVEPRYDRAFTYLASQVRKRSLVVLITNVIDEVNRIEIEQYLAHVVGRHLPVGVLLRDYRLFEAADGPIDDEAAQYRAAAAANIINWRQTVIRDLEHRGVLSLDVFPDRLTAPLVNQYLDIKARHLL